MSGKIKMVPVGSILSQKEIADALALYDRAPSGQFAKLCAEQIIQPVIDRINSDTEQENDVSYLAYCIEYAILKSRGTLHS